MSDLDTLALEAKCDSRAFERLLQEMDGYCRKMAYYYSSVMEYDDLLQMARIEVWKAVLSYQPGKMPFVSYCKWTVLNHMKGYLHRQFGPKHMLSRAALRLQAQIGGEDSPMLESLIPSPSDVPRTLEKKELHMQLRRLLTRSLSDMEYRCLVYFYYEGYRYTDIQDKLKLASGKSVGNALKRLKMKLGKNKELFEILTSLSA
ncbi:sigma-70 family RNA polymerase sigma factor [Paenibacillus thermotolerans]|uniref:sigma-70 family RNA polymerase sigma factor n=1 Tax=Paenibacillus thermotolerans TaxID=3027807 RepID=UPI0023686B45|nr:MULTISPECIES: sigma-70 family RNA polymerase sigma factor [unclassified Paenibacillus]